MGAKGKYQEWLTDDGLTILRGWARDGLTDEQIARNMDISKETFYRWKRDFSDFSNALKKGKEIVDNEVEESILKSAMGYMVTETKVEHMPDGKEKITEQERHIPPNVTALIFWLKNRRPEKWRDKRDVNMGTTETPSVNIKIQPVKPKQGDS